MSDPYVREVGHVVSHYGTRMSIGVDYDTVSLKIGPTLGVLLTAAQAEEFAQLFVSAVWQAGQQKRQLDEEIHEADGGGTMAEGTSEAGYVRRNVVITACADPGCGGDCGG